MILHSSPSLLLILKAHEKSLGDKEPVRSFDKKGTVCPAHNWSHKPIVLLLSQGPARWCAMIHLTSGSPIDVQTGVGLMNPLGHVHFDCASLSTYNSPYSKRLGLITNIKT